MQAENKASKWDKISTTVAVLSLVIAIVGIVIADNAYQSSLSKSVILYDSTRNIPFTNLKANYSVASFRQVTVEANVQMKTGIPTNLLTTNGTVYVDNQITQVFGWDIFGTNKSGTYYFGVSKVVPIIGEELWFQWNVTCACSLVARIQIGLYLTH